MSLGTSWIMIMIRLDVRNHDSRRYSVDEYNETEIIISDTKEGLLARCYRLRESQKKFEPISVYDTGTKFVFCGPIEVVNNSTWRNADGTEEHWFEEGDALNETKVKEAIASGAVLHQILK